ncbi:MAG: tetratricopeptide repeat protein [Myxococcota bacterium]
MKTEPTLPNVIRDYEINQKMRRTERTLIAAGLCGVAVATAALLWPVPKPKISATPIVAPIASPSPAPRTVAITEPIVIEGSPVEVQVARPVIPIEHQDHETDFLAKSSQQIESGDTRGAFESLRKHLYDHPPTVEVLTNIGRLGYQLKELGIAEQALLDAGALAPNDIDVAIERGRILLEGGDTKEARTAARQAVRIDKDNAYAWNLAGRVAMADSSWERAESAFKQAVELAPTDPMIHNNLGLLYILMKKPEAAVDSLEASAELYGDEVPYFVHNNLGLAYEQAGRLEDAQDAFESAAVANPDYARAQVNLQRVLKRMASVVERDARARRTAALELRPSPEPEPSPSPDEDLPETDEGEDR